MLDPSLAGPLSLVTEVSLLQVCITFYSFFFAYGRIQQHGIDKMFWLESGPLSAVTTSIVYLCRPRIKWMKIIAGIQFPGYYSTVFILEDRPDQATQRRVAETHLHALPRAQGLRPHHSSARGRGCFRGCHDFFLQSSIHSNRG